MPTKMEEWADRTVAKQGLRNGLGWKKFVTVCRVRYGLIKLRLCSAAFT
jgi:hypothetical protein